MIRYLDFPAPCADEALCVMKSEKKKKLDWRLQLTWFSDIVGGQGVNRVSNRCCEPSGAALSAAVSSSLSQNIADVVGQAGAAPLTSLQIHFIQNMIHETLEDFRLVPDFCLLPSDYWCSLMIMKCQRETWRILMVSLCLLLCRDSCHRDIVNLQVEMVRQFYIQLVRTISASFSLFILHVDLSQLLLFVNQIKRKDHISIVS